MESLIANYASSDDEADVLPDQSNRHQPNQTLISSSPSSSSNSKSSSTPATSKLFSALPQPKPNLSSTTAGAKRIVQFRPPIPASLANPSAAGDDEDEDDEGEKEKERKRRRESQSSAHASSVKSFLSSIPAPRNSSTLGALPSAGSGRRSILDTDSTAPSSRAFEANDGGNDLDAGNSVNCQSYVSGTDQTSGNLGYSEDYTSYQSGYDQNASGSDGSYYGGSENYANYGEYGNYADYSDYANVAMAGDVQEAGESAVRVSAKRGRNEVPADIVEVKQDELMKNRPREDQVKLTGIAFGPAYQPVSTKGKPSKLHKRKHQIGSLYFDMKQKETELSERRARGFLTKAQTQAKYGW